MFAIPVYARISRFTGTHPIRILLVEASRARQRSMHRMLNGKRHGQYQAEFAASLEKAATLLISKQFDVILANLSLPDSKGYQTFADIFLLARGVPVVVMTRRWQELAGMRALREGARHWLISHELKAPQLENAILRATGHQSAWHSPAVTRMCDHKVYHYDEESCRCAS